MATNYVRTDQNAYLSLGTSRLVSVATSPATEIVFTVSGGRSIHFMNNGPAAMSYGDSGVLAVSNGVLFPYTQFLWDNVHRDFSVFVVADSVASRLSVVEYTSE